MCELFKKKIKWPIKSLILMNIFNFNQAASWKYHSKVKSPKNILIQKLNLKKSF